MRISALRLVWMAMMVGALCVALGAPGVAAEEPASEAAVAQAIDSGVVAYYFYGKKRCATCRKLEAYSEEAIAEGFAKEIDAGSLSWRAVNMEEPPNEHFATDFELAFKAVVLAEYEDGKVKRFKNLDKIWEKVGDKEGFVTYIRSETRAFLGEG